VKLLEDISRELSGAFDKQPTAGELYADEFQYWPRADARRKTRR